MIRFLLGRCPHVCLRVLCLWFVPRLIYIILWVTAYSIIYIYIYINQTGDEPQKQDKQASKRTPPLREEVTYQITLIGLRQRQGSLDSDRRRREKVIVRKMFTEDDC